MIQEAIDKLVSGCSLTQETAADAMRQIMAGEATEAQIGSLVTALRMKGETPEEIAGMAQVMRESSLHVEVEGPLVDTAGTGGDASNTFNISTTAAFVIAGAGVRVAKHGNRAMSGATGSADVLEALGVKIDLSPEGVKTCLEIGRHRVHVRPGLPSIHEVRRRASARNRDTHRLQRTRPPDESRRSQVAAYRRRQP